VLLVVLDIYGRTSDPSVENAQKLSRCVVMISFKFTSAYRIVAIENK
jgi:hypothetical protein